MLMHKAIIKLVMMMAVLVGLYQVLIRLIIKRGYADGQAACSGGGRNPMPQPLQNPPPQNNPGPSSSDWTLTVNINNVNFGESSIGVSIKGPFGYNDYQIVSNGPSPTATFTIPGNAVPSRV